MPYTHRVTIYKRLPVSRRPHVQGRIRRRVGEKLKIGWKELHQVNNDGLKVEKRLTKILFGKEKLTIS